MADPARHIITSGWLNIALRHFLHNHGNIATEGRLNRDYAAANDFKGSL